MSRLMLWYIVLICSLIIVDAMDNPEAIISPQIKQMLLVLQVRTLIYTYKVHTIFMDVIRSMNF